MTEVEAGQVAPEILRWLQSLSSDIQTLREALLDRHVPPAAKRLIVSAMGYGLRALDLVPDQIAGGAGLADDCFVLRVAAELVMRHRIDNLPLPTLQKLSRLANDAATVRDFLGVEGYAALEAFVEKLPEQEFRGRTADQVISDEIIRGQFMREVADGQKDFKAPAELDPTRLESEVRTYLLTKLGVLHLQ